MREIRSSIDVRVSQARVAVLVGSEYEVSRKAL